jgi:hypothetical protein
LESVEYEEEEEEEDAAGEEEWLSSYENLNGEGSLPAGKL